MRVMTSSVDLNAGGWGKMVEKPVRRLSWFVVFDILFVLAGIIVI